MRSQALITTLATALLLAACSMQKNMDDMKGTTEHMDKTTTSMDATTSHVSKDSDEMDAKLGEMSGTTDEIGLGTRKLVYSMGEMYDAGRQGTTVDLRQKLFKDIVEAESGARKISSAAKYFDSFEFQIWSGTMEGDSLVRRQKLFEDAANEFMADVLEFWTDSETVKPLATKTSAIPLMSGDNKNACFNAMAVALDYVNRKQLEMHALHSDIPVDTMLTIIVKGLEDGMKVRSGQMHQSEMTPASVAVESNKNVAIKLLQARQNELSLMTLAKISPLGLEGTISGYLEASKTFWNLDLAALDLSLMQVTSYYLNQAELTRQLLADKLKVAPQIDSSVSGIWAHAEVIYNQKIISTQDVDAQNVRGDFYKFVEAEKAAK